MCGSFQMGKDTSHLKYRSLTVGEPENQYPTSKEVLICLTKRERYNAKIKGKMRKRDENKTQFGEKRRQF